MIKLRTLLFSLTSGVLLGSGGVWLIHFAPDNGSNRQSAAAHQTPGPVLITPARLNQSDADTVIKDWLELPELAKDCPSAEQSERRIQLRAMLARLPDDRFPSLLDVLVTREVDTECNLRRLAFEVWTERNAPAAAQWAARQTSEHYTKSHQRGDSSLAVQAWARDDWDAAYNWSRNLEDASFNDYLANALLEQLASTDPQRALTIAQSRGDQFFKSARNKLFKTWSQKNPADAVRWFTPQLSVDDVNRWDFQNAAALWIAASPNEALDWLSQIGPANNNSSRTLIESMLHQVSIIPEAAKGLADALLKRADLTDQNKLLTNLLAYWQNRDGAATLAWLDSLKDERKRGELVDQIIRRWGISDGLTRVEFNLRLPEGGQRSDAIKSSLTSWAKSNPDDALAWIEKHPKPEYAQIIDSIQGVRVGNLATTDLQGALGRWQELPEGDAKKTAMGPIVDSWSKQDPVAAANWLLTRIDLSQGNNYPAEDSLQKLMHNWSTSDPAAALRWAEQYPNKQTRWTVINALTNQYGESDIPDPKARAALYTTVKDGEIRKNLLQRNAWIWLRTDYKAASAWLESSDEFTPEQVAQMLVSLDPYSR